MTEIAGRKFVITGGSSGIGLATGRELVKRGAEVAIVSRRTQVAAAAVAELGASAWIYPCDVSDVEQVAGLAAEVSERWGSLDGLVNTAGVAPMASLVETEPEMWDETFAINVRGPYLVCRSLHPYLERGTAPAVVNVSSNLAEKAIPGMAAYNASKAALNQLTRSLALEWAPTVRVCAVMPGVVDTPIHELRGLDREQVEGMGAMHPMRRIGRPLDVASLIVFLLSEQASWMTGVVIPIDGGMLAT